MPDFSVPGAKNVVSAAGAKEARRNDPTGFSIYLKRLKYIFAPHPIVCVSPPFCRRKTLV